MVACRKPEFTYFSIDPSEFSAPNPEGKGLRGFCFYSNHSKVFCIDQILPRYKNLSFLLGSTRSTYIEPEGAPWYPASVNS